MTFFVSTHSHIAHRMMMWPSLQGNYCILLIQWMADSTYYFLFFGVPHMQDFWPYASKQARSHHFIFKPPHLFPHTICHLLHLCMSLPYTFAVFIILFIEHNGQCIVTCEQEWCKGDCTANCPVSYFMKFLIMRKKWIGT